MTNLNLYNRIIGMLDSVNVLLDTLGTRENKTIVLWNRDLFNAYFARLRIENDSLVLFWEGDGHQ